MKRQLFTILLVALTGLFAGCRSTPESEMSGMTAEMMAEIKTVRAQMEASGASTQQLREFDRAMAEMKKSMRQVDRQMERQMRALESGI